MMENAFSPLIFHRRIRTCVGWLCVITAVIVRGETGYRPPSKYVAELPGGGFATLELHEEYQNLRQAELSWLDIRIRCCWERDDDRVFIYRLGDYGHQEPAEIAFVLAPSFEGHLEFCEGGLITAARLESFRPTRWLSFDNERSPGYSLRRRAKDQHRKLFDHGSLKPSTLR